MDIRSFVYVLMMLTQLVCLVFVGRTAGTCQWSRQARWIAWRTGGVTFGVLMMTIFFFTGRLYDDALLECVIIVGLASMTLLLLGKLPTILAGMSDARVADDLNIQQDNEDTVNN